MSRILIVEDEQDLASLLEYNLKQEGFEIDVARTGAAGVSRARSFKPDLILLDLMLPDIGGTEVARLVREQEGKRIPIIMVTARGEESDRVRGLELGADDYVGKPFSPRELLARLRAVLRRARPEVMSEQLTVGDIVVDVPARTAVHKGAQLDLTGIEFDILVALVRRAGRVVPRDALLSEAGRSDVVVGERTIDVHISHLRQKLGDDPPKLIKTVRGVGYVLTKD